MTAAVPRFRLFAGPNGSGKSTLNRLLPQSLLGVYLNADDLERTVRGTGILDLSAHGVTAASAPAVVARAAAHPLMARATSGAGRWTVNGTRISFAHGSFGPYDAAAWTDAVRRQADR